MNDFQDHIFHQKQEDKEYILEVLGHSHDLNKNVFFSGGI